MARTVPTSEQGRGHTRTTARGAAAVPAWRHRYPAYPRILLILTGTTPTCTPARLHRRIADLRSLAHTGPLLTTTPIRAGATTLDHLREHGPFAPIFTPVLGAADPVDAWLRLRTDGASTT
ncbi:hypothetical protein ACFZB9_23040 [Kitasatospora sp. NPDC008050]|uniref:hypothetical protein n=1 Tax=Kitasatospora sp. NPDC008050 TaxID=3364021 RepID=UPI0036E05BA1